MTSTSVAESLFLVFVTAVANQPIKSRYKCFCISLRRHQNNAIGLCKDLTNSAVYWPQTIFLNIDYHSKLLSRYWMFCKVMKQSGKKQSKIITMVHWFHAMFCLYCWLLPVCKKMTFSLPVKGLIATHFYSCADATCHNSSKKAFDCNIILHWNWE